MKSTLLFCLLMAFMPQASAQLLLLHKTGNQTTQFMSVEGETVDSPAELDSIYVSMDYNEMLVFYTSKTTRKHGSWTIHLDPSPVPDLPGVVLFALNHELFAAFGMKEEEDHPGVIRGFLVLTDGPSMFDYFTVKKMGK
jgi:hypothetical protein